MFLEKKLPSSFRDPDGFLFHQGGRLYRQINSSAKEHYDSLIRSGLYQKLVGQRLLIPHQEVDRHLAITDDVYKIIQPEAVPFISYPFEWCFSQLKDAAFTTLRIQQLALEHGMSLKDSSAYNIQFRKGKPLLIDTLSLEKYEEGKPWVAYRQFCQHFVAPLALMAYRDVRLNQLSRIYIDGIPLDLVCALLPHRTRWKPGLAMHLHLHAKSQKHFANKEFKLENRRFSKIALLGLLNSLESCVGRLKWEPKETEWSFYYEDTNYSDQAAQEKKKWVGLYLAQLKPGSLWDLGANTGRYSRLSSGQGIPTVALDIDPAAVEINYLEMRKQKEENLLPLWMDLTNPTPAFGWGHEERMAIEDRGPVDMVTALALIHHLAIAHNLSFGHIAQFLSRLCRYLVIEFVAKSDSQVQRLLASREDIFPDYNAQSFEKHFSIFFEIQEAVRIEDTQRTLYLMKNRNSTLNYML